MSSSQVPSLSRSQGATIRATSPSRRKSRRTRSVSSSTSNISPRLTAVIPDSLPMSPLPTRCSVLNDDTDIEIPERQNWWKRLTVNSRRVTDMMEERENEDKAAEEFNVEILSQEKENMSLNLPESSDGESIHSIVLPQRELFRNRGNRPKNKLKEIINRKESLGKMQKSIFDQTNIDIDIHVMPKKLFNRAPKPKTKSVFNAALFNASPNKTVNVNNSIEKPAQEIQGPVRKIFGYRPGIKRKNIYAEFVLSDSDDEFSEIQPRIFGFQTKKDHQKASKQRSSVYSSALNITDEEMGEWNHLPSSTMVEHQFEEAGGTTPTKRIRLSKSRKSKNSLNKNNSLNTSRRSSQVKSNSKIRPEVEDININTRSQSFNKSKNNSQVQPKSINSYVETNKTNSVRESSQKNSSKLTHKVSMDETLTDEVMQVNLVSAEHEKTLTEEYQHDQVDNDNFTLMFEDDEQIFDINVKNFEANQNISNETDKHSQKSNDTHIASEVIESANVEIHSNQTDKIFKKKDILESPEAVLHEKMNAEESYTAHGRNTSINKDPHIASEIIETANVEIHSNQTDKIYRQKDILKSPEAVIHEKTNTEESYTAQGRNISINEDPHIASETIETVNVEIHSNQTDKIYRKKDILKSPEAVLHDKTNREESYTAHGRNTSISKDPHIASDIIETANVEIHSNQTDEIYRKTDILKSPEAVLYEKTNREESYTAHGRNTNMSKSKTIPKDLDIRPSLAPARESSGFTDGTLGSSSECSVWDSHRTTRQTLRQTFGKDFTPRKSLRTLVMERAAKRQTNYNQNDQVADKSGFQTDADQSKPTTSYSKIANKSKDKSTRRTSSNKKAYLNQSKRQTDENPTRSNQEIDKNEKVESNEENKQNEEPDIEKNLDIQFGGESKQNEEFESDPKRKQNIKTVTAIDLQPNEFVQNNRDIDKNENVESNEESKQNEETDTEKNVDVQFGGESKQNEEFESDPKREENIKSGSAIDLQPNELVQNQTIESDKDIELYEKLELEKDVSQNEGIESDTEFEQNEKSESFNEQNIESELEQNEEVESDAESEQNNESESFNEQEQNLESELKPNEEVESDAESEQNEESESFNEQEQNVASELEQNEEVESDAESEQNEESESFNEQEHNVESELEQNEKVESDSESEQNEESESFNEQEQNVASELEKNEEVESDAESEQNEESESFNELEQNKESELEQNEAVQSGQNIDQTGESEFYNEQEQNVESEFEQNEESESSNEEEQSKEFESYREPELLEVEKMAEKVHHDATRQLRQANLEKYLQKVKEENAELRRKVQEKVLNSLKVQPKPFSIFKVPEIPKKQRTTKIIKKAPKAKLKSTIFTNLDHLPAEFFEDLKYKPPKRFQGRNAPWITKRLYKFLEDKLQPKYDYHARVRAEKLVEKLYLFAKDVRKCARAAPQDAIWELKLEMARLGIVATHHEFYCFFHEFMPREIRIRVNPDILNKIPLPRNVFGNIMEE